MTFTWAPYGSSGVFMVTLAIYNQQGTQLLGYVACVGPDQGFLTFPGSYLAQYPSYSLVAIHLDRHKVEMVPYPPLGSFIETHMEWSTVGTGFLYLDTSSPQLGGGGLCRVRHLNTTPLGQSE